MIKLLKDNLINKWYLFNKNWNKYNNFIKMKLKIINSCLEIINLLHKIHISI